MTKPMKKHSHTMLTSLNCVCAKTGVKYSATPLNKLKAPLAALDIKQQHNQINEYGMRKSRVYMMGFLVVMED